MSNEPLTSNEPLASTDPLTSTEPWAEQATAISATARSCPECGMPAWLDEGDDESGDWTGEYGDRLVRVRCVARHWFLMLASRVPAF